MPQGFSPQDVVPLLFIEGFGDGDKSYLLSKEISMSTANYEVVNIMYDLPSTLSQKTNLLENWYGASGLDVPIYRFEEEASARALRKWAWQSRPDAKWLLAEDIAESTFLFDIEAYPPYSTAPAIGDILYIEREAMYVGAVSGSGPWEVNVTRGLHGTDPKSHYSGLLDDKFIYTENPIVIGRRAILYEASLADIAGSSDISADLSPVWTGVIDDISMVDHLTSLNIQIRDSLAMVGDKVLGEEGLHFIGSAGLTGVGNRAHFHPDAVESVMVRFDVDNPTVGVPDGTKSNLFWTTMSDGEAVLAVQVKPSQQENGSFIKLSNNAEVLFETGGHLEVGGFQEAGNTAWREVLVSTGDYNMFADSDGNATSNPFNILLNILTSTGGCVWTNSSRTVGTNGAYDWLPDRWGMGVPVEFIDVDAIEALRDAWLYAGLEMKNMIYFGYDPVNVAECLQKLCQALFIYPTQTTEGKISFFSIFDRGEAAVKGTFGPDDYIESVRGQPYSTSRRIRRTLVKLKKYAGTDDYALTQIDIDFADRVRRRYPWASEDLEIDAGWFGDAESNQITDSLKQKIIAINTMRYGVLWDRLPEYTLKFNASVVNLARGDIIKVVDPYLIGPDGEEGVSARCIVLEHHRDPATRNLTVTVMDLSPISGADNVVSPSWRVASAGAGPWTATEFDIESAEFTSNDLQYWEVSRNILLYNKRGTLRSTDGPTTGTLSSETVTLDSAWQAGGVNVVPAEGDVVRLATYDNAGDWSSVDGYSWLAGSDGQLGTAGDAGGRWS